MKAFDCATPPGLPFETSVRARFAKEGRSLNAALVPPFQVTDKADKWLRDFIIRGGFDIVEEFAPQTYSTDGATLGMAADDEVEFE